MDLSGVELLCLDAGNTVIFLDHERLGALVGIEPSVLVRTEGEAKRLAETNGLVDVEWGSRDKPGAASWGRMLATIASRAGLHAETLPEGAEAVLRRAMRAEVDLELKNSPRPLFAEMSSGREG